MSHLSSVLSLMLILLVKKMFGTSVGIPMPGSDTYDFNTHDMTCVIKVKQLEYCITCLEQLFHEVGVSCGCPF